VRTMTLSGYVFNMQFRKVPRGSWLFSVGRKLHTHTRTLGVFLSFFFPRRRRAWQ